MARREFPWLRRGRRGERRTRATGDDRPPAAPGPPPSWYEPRRRYPWYDDPDGTAAHRGDTPPSWPPVPPPEPARPEPALPPTREMTLPDARAAVPWTAAGPPPVDLRDGVRDDRLRDDLVDTDVHGPLAPAHPGADPPADAEAERPAQRMPRKLTVTRVAALRSRELTRNTVRAFHRAARADGADRSGMTALTYATMMTYAVDAAVAVALANTLFFAAATAESRTNVALYLAITVAPFAVVAPVIGPLLDRLQRGRRAALAVSFAGRAVLAVVMAFNYDTWLLYPAALGVMVLSKSFVVLKAAVTPRVLPSAITLVTTNARLTVFGLAAGAVFGGVAVGVAAVFGSPGALLYTAALAVWGAVLCLRIPRWVESTAGEVPAALRSTVRGRRRPISRGVVVALWGNGSIRVLTGFLTLFVAFVVKNQTEADPTRQLLLIGVVGAAAGLGSFAGNAVGSRLRFGRSEAVVLWCIGAAAAVTAVAAAVPGIPAAAVVGLVAATASALAKVSLDAVVQRDLPEESRASAFGRSETVLQLAWVSGGGLGILLPHSTFWIGFAVMAAVLALGGVQTALIARGRSLLPFLRHRARPAEEQPTRTVG